MVLAKDQISLINVNDGYVGEDGKSYVLNITGGQRSITYNEVGSNPTPSPSAFSCEFFVNGALTNPTVYSWSATGHLSGTSSTNSFTPNYAASFNSSFSNSVVLSAVYNGITFRAVAPIAITKIGEIRYTWIKYADDVSGGGLSDSSIGKKYIGIAINKTTSTESSIAGDYTWSMFEGPVGPGGADGDTSYLHVAYATNSTGTTGFSTTVSTAKTYLGQYTDFNPTSSSNPALYNWTLIKGADGYTPVKGTDYFDGINGTNGANGISSYLWIRYSQNVDGSSMTTSPTGAKYIGTATTTTAVAPTLYTSYNWTLIKGADGISGEAGADGQTSYLHIKYSNDGGTTFTATTGETVGDWIGTYVDFAPADSASVSAYTWNKVKGEVGSDGVSITGVVERYLATTASTGVTTGTAGWTTTIQNTTVTNKYLWNYETVQYSDGSSTPTLPVIIGTWGNTGATGATGRALLSVVEWYLASPSATGITRASGGWTTAMQTTTDVNKYLWNYEVLTWSTGTITTYVEPIVIGVHGAKGDNGLQGVQGIQGPNGTQGIQGPIGPNGLPSYTHIAYATGATGQDFSTSHFASATYIGIYVDNTATDSVSYLSYKWSLIKGLDGTQGIQGPVGPNGLASYFHTAWATNATGTTGFSTTDSTGKLYLGTYSDNTSADSNTASMYTWTLIKGDQGIQGPVGNTGATLYTWLKYADTPTTGMNDSPTGKTYMGLAYNKTTSTESSTYADYTWSLIKGDTGVQGPIGTTGATLYTWVKYADTPTTGMSDSPTGKKYFGIAYNKSSATKSLVYTDYAWSLTEGIQGIQGNDGRSITSVDVWYYNSTSATALANSTWVTTAPAWINGRYIWSKTITTYSSGSPTESAPACITGAQGVTGNTGSTGATGKGISSTVVTYQSHTNGTTAPTGTWVASVPTVTAGNYLWTKTYITYTDAQTSTIYSVALMGATGSTGATGANGTTITSVTITYQVNTSGTTTPTGTWLSSIPAVTASQYLWTRTVTTYSNIATTTAYSVGMMGATGSTGATGTTGATGKGVTSISEEYAISTSKTVAPTVFSTTRPTWTAGNYIWTRSVIVYNNPTSTVNTVPVVSTEWEAVNEIQIGGRNLFQKGRISVPVDTTEDFILSGWASEFMNTQMTLETLKEGVEYTISYDMELIERTPVPTYYSYSEGFFLYSAEGSNDISFQLISVKELGDKARVEATFICPPLTDQRILYYTNRYTTSGGNPIGLDTIRFSNLKLEKGNKATDWTPAPEDIDAQLGEKATNDAVNKIAEGLGGLTGVVNGKADAGSLSDLESAYLLRVSQQAVAELATTEALELMGTRVEGFRTEFGAKKLVWSFIENKIEASEEGIFIGDKETQMGIFISVLPDPNDATKKIGRISFLDSGNEVAYISNNVMQINHGIFVESAIIGKHKIETIANTDISVFTYIG